MYYKSEVKGRGGIVARVVAKSGSTLTDDKLCTWEVEYPRIVHSELMTHKMLSKNASSSRAIPISTVIKQVWNNPAMPVEWGKNQPGMQADKLLSGWKKTLTRAAWVVTSKFACGAAFVMHKLGAHKQIANRILEPFQFIKVVISGTEIENFFWLRCHKDADPTIRELAVCMQAAYDRVPTTWLSAGDWHVPYYAGGCWRKNSTTPLQDALAISSSCCAQVSYRRLDDSLAKAYDIEGKLTSGERVHASPFEHQGTPIDNMVGIYDQPGVTHARTSDFSLWSANLRGFIQYRQLIPNHTKEKELPNV